MSHLNVGGISVADGNEGQVRLPMAIAGAVGGALAMGAVYGVLGMFIGEFKYVAIASGLVSGIAAMKLGGGRSVPAGIVAAVATLIGLIGGKLLMGPSENWVAYHTTLFDILFCYIGAPAAAFATAGTDKARELLDRLPIRF